MTTIVKPSPTSQLMTHLRGNMNYASAQAYRVKGGAIVTIMRADGTTRRHKVNSRRFLWLRSLFGLASDGGWFSSTSFDCELSKPLMPEIRWLRSQGSR